MDHLAVDLLQSHDEHRAVRLPQDGRPHLDDVVGPDGEEAAIERGVMELAQCDTIADEECPPEWWDLSEAPDLR
jgi:hypothetical protein